MGIVTVILSPAAWPVAVVDAWAQRLRTTPELVQTVASGTTPRPVYALLGAHAALFRRATIFLLDEFGGMAPGHPGRSETMVRTDLLTGIGLGTHPGDDVFRVPVVDGDADTVDAAASAYERSITDAGGLGLAVLGIGTNGHIGMNEPGTPADARTRRVALAASTTAATARYGATGDLPTWGVTIGLGTLLEATEVWVLATGASKAAAVRDAVEGPVTTDLPASLLQHHPNCTFWLDEDAAGLLSRR